MEFFKSIKGGPHDGLSFFPWYIWNYWYIMIFIISGTAIAATQKDYFYNISNEPFWYWFMVIFMFSIAGLILFKSLQHWNDLKNGRSR